MEVTFVDTMPIGWNIFYLILSGVFTVIENLPVQWTVYRPKMKQNSVNNRSHENTEPV